MPVPLYSLSCWLDVKHQFPPSYTHMLGDGEDYAERPTAASLMATIHVTYHLYGYTYVQHVSQILINIHITDRT